MASQPQDPLHILFFPFMAPGHMIPVVDMAKLFSSRGVHCTIITTPANVPLIQPAIDGAAGHDSDPRRSISPVSIAIIESPFKEAGLPDGCENATKCPPHLKANFFGAINMFRQPFEQVLRDRRPDAVVTDVFMTWTADVALELGVPHLLFHGTSLFAHCVSHSIRYYKPLETLPREAESFVVPGLPHRIELLRSQEPDPRTRPSWVLELFDQMKEAEEKSYGVLVNSFYELEPDYAEHYRNVIGRKVWHMGPVSLCNKDVAQRSRRGDKASIDIDNCLAWLHSKEPSSVIYMCFGSVSRLSDAQLQEMALGLEASNQPFIWVVRDVGNGGTEWLPEGYKERVAGTGKGLIIKGWAPQILILEHPAVGGLVTHCGWNSTLEGITAGVPMVTWPLSNEQFYNEKLVVEVLRIGISVGVKEYRERVEERKVVAAADIARAAATLMGGGEETEGMRRRAKELAGMAKKAVEHGGSSYEGMGNLIEQLMNEKRSPR